MAPREQIKWERIPIAPEDLFKSRVTKPGEQAREIHRVLLVGNAGMGKTTLSEQIAYRWAEGQWYSEFEAVYVLPVRKLRASKYDNDGGYRKEATLPTAIVNLCFTPPTDEEDYKALRSHVAASLEKPKTLVVLDGLDERAGASDCLLSQAKGGKHKLLMLSRSYNIDGERSLADIEVEHAGLSNAQMRDYVSANLSAEQSKSFLALIDRNPSIAAISQVPVNLEILCFLWRDQASQLDVSGTMSGGSLSALYRVVTRKMWDRYAKNSKLELLSNREALFDTLGQIAFEALRKGAILISQTQVDEHADESSILANPKAMQASGFLFLEWLKDNDANARYQFPHLTFQEYFAGRWFAKQLFPDDKEKKKEKKKEAESFFKANKYEPRYGRMFSFMAGIIVGTKSKKKRQECLHHLLSLSKADASPPKSIAPLLLQMRVLNELLCVSDQEAVKDEFANLEREFKVLDAFKQQFEHGIELIRPFLGYNPLRPLTSGLRDCSAVARTAAPQCLKSLLRVYARYNLSNWAYHESILAVLQVAPAQGLEFILGASHDKDKSVRACAMQFLGELSRVSPAHAHRCIERLQVAAEKDEDASVRDAARSAYSPLPFEPFGKKLWEEYFGDVGEAPDLPSDIDAILDRACPFWPDKKVKDTHLLVLMPATVDGAPFMLNLLRELIQRPKNGGHRAECEYYSDRVQAQFGEESPGRSYWLLMTRDVLEGSRDKTYSDQKGLVESHARRTGQPYEVPGALEAATAILMHHARTGERLFGDRPFTYTRCQKLLDGKLPVVVGGFESLGLLVSHNLFHRCNSNGVAGCRKFFRALGPLVFGT